MIIDKWKIFLGTFLRKRRCFLVVFALLEAAQDMQILQFWTAGQGLL